MAAQSPWIIDATMRNFEQDVVRRSEQVPVVIDFWAPWCGPCKQLAPVLEQLAAEYNGRFYLAKINTDEQQELAAAFRVQSIPWVVAFRGGQPVDQFMGALPEPEIRRWLEALMPSPAEQLLAQAISLEATNPREAEAKYRELLEMVPDADATRIRLARLLLTQGRLGEVRTMINTLEQRGWLEPEAERLKSELDVREAASETGGVEAARNAAAANPHDLTLQLRLADTLAAAQQHEKALQICLDIIQRDRGGVGVEAKATMVKIFDMLGPAL